MKLAAIRPNVELPKACPEVEVVKRLKAIFPEVPADLAKENPGLCRGRHEPGDLQSPSSTEGLTCKDFGGTPLLRR